MNKPNIGDIVHYQRYGSPGGEHKAEPSPAIVTQVFEDGECMLFVMNPNGLYFNCTPYSETPKPGHWSWPRADKGHPLFQAGYRAGLYDRKLEEEEDDELTIAYLLEADRLEGIKKDMACLPDLHTYMLENSMNYSLHFNETEYRWQLEADGKTYGGKKGYPRLSHVLDLFKKGQDDSLMENREMKFKTDFTKGGHEILAIHDHPKARFFIGYVTDGQIVLACMWNKETGEDFDGSDLFALAAGEPLGVKGHER
jgi:hypothetical protein